MKAYTLITGVAAVLAGLAIQTSTLAQDTGVKAAGVSDSPDKQIRFKFPLGFSFANGAYDLDQKLRDSFIANGYSVSDNFVWPIGLSLNPRIEFPFGGSIGATVGPTEFFAVGKTGSGSSSSAELNCIVPIGAYVQYNLFQNKPISPYARAGFRYPITGGDYLGSSTVGPFVAGGVEFLRTKKIGLGIEAGYDWSEVSVSAGPTGGEQRVKPIGFNVGVFVIF